MSIKTKQHSKEIFEEFLIQRVGHNPQKYSSGAFMEYKVKLFYALWEQVLPQLNLDWEQDKIFDGFIILAVISSYDFQKIKGMFI